jgi:hypothetical protein
MGGPIEMTPLWEARVARRVLLAAVMSGAFCGTLRAQPTQPLSARTLSDAIGFLKHEKSAAEQYGVILFTVARDDAGVYVRGIKLYADAKAEFDGLIAELRFDFLNGQDPSKSAKFNDALKAAAEKCVAFTSFVSAQVDKLPGARPGLPDVIEVVPDLIKAITESGLSIWNAFRQARKEDRDAILSELEHLEWRSFADLAKP